MKRSKYGNKVTIDDPKFPLAGPGITPVAPPFPLDLKDKVVGEKSTDTPKTLPPIKEKKVRKPKKDKAERIQSDGLSEDSSATILDRSKFLQFNAQTLLRTLYSVLCTRKSSGLEQGTGNVRMQNFSSVRTRYPHASQF